MTKRFSHDLYGISDIYRHLFVSPWYSEIKGVISYIRHQKEKFPEHQTISVPYHLTRWFSFIDNLTIDVDFVECDDRKKFSGSYNERQFEHRLFYTDVADTKYEGSVDVEMNESSGRLKYVHFNLVVCDGQIHNNSHGLINGLCVEFDNLYHIWAENCKEHESVELANNDGTIQSMFNDRFLSTENLYDVGKVYCELKREDSKGSDVTGDMTMTSAYKRFEKQKEMIEYVKNECSEEDAEKFYWWLIDKKCIRDRRSEDETFKEYVMKFLIKSANTYLRDIVRSGVLYFNELYGNNNRFLDVLAPVTVSDKAGNKYDYVCLTPSDKINMKKLSVYLDGEI